MRLFIWALILLAGCGDAGKAPQPASAIKVAGYLQEKSLDEASGLARSHREADLLWAINDDGPAVLHALDQTGAKLGKVKISKINNRDWEDLASFELDGQAYLLVADIGDNAARRKDVSLYVVKEPDAVDKKVKVERRIDFSYPQGPRDAEAVAVDTAQQRILILTKRDIPAELYELPLAPDTDKTITATYLGIVDTLPQPTRQDIRDALAKQDWYWQPTGMDIAADGQSLLIVTYRGIYYYAREEQESWLDAVGRPPLGLRFGSLDAAESITFGDSDDIAFVTTEKKNAPLLRVDLSSAREPAERDNITIMTFNVENLFDNIDDPDKDDASYLPIEAKQADAHIAGCNKIEVESWRNTCLNLDWSDATIDHKLSVIADTIKQVADGRGADIIALQEIENISILERLRTEHLEAGDYLPAILLEGTDTRGIDVAFLSRLPVVDAPKLHPLHIDGYEDRIGDTRGVLQATFELPDGELLTGFSVHFPAPFHPTEMRVAAYNQLNDLHAKLPDSHYVFAAGDFNTTSSEDTEKNMFDRFVRPFWSAAHDLCDGCPGTQFYARDDTWSFLDLILFSPVRGENTTWRIRADSVRIANANPAQVQDPGIPLRYNAKAQVGVSDHWPLVMSIESTQKQ